MKLKYILTLVVVIALIIVGITVGANNDQVIAVNYIIAKSDIQLSSLVAILFGFGFLLGWLVTGFFYLKLKMKNIALNRQIKKQLQQINELMTARDKNA
ncbi:lipopolysaccharide assembly protein LapA domain-containing protein [Gallibacterium salpingitidis]|uniref:LapA family protein n=1 Tax=Gallibacterium salpingitidis TaxID=505341 RepID=UPI00266FE127|nr:lipopolysaccharide assembly protein LapA domain-containing protein [Gallibacterium salpingitidis]WKS99016.1 lipopolysaccharide assembly protein LapA domain-containing protein [Gallibacterium salpingitidis]